MRNKWRKVETFTRSSPDRTLTVSVSINMETITYRVRAYQGGGFDAGADRFYGDREVAFSVALQRLDYLWRNA